MIDWHSAASVSTALIPLTTTSWMRGISPRDRRNPRLRDLPGENAISALTKLPLRHGASVAAATVEIDLRLKKHWEAPGTAAPTGRRFCLGKRVDGTGCGLAPTGVTSGKTGRGTMKHLPLVFGLVAAAFSIGLAPGTAPAQDYPTRPIKFVVGFPPGGAIDLGARHFAEKLGALAKQPVVIENKPGAGGIVAADAVAHSKPDGYTIFYSPLDTLASAKYLYKSLTFDPLKDFVAVAATAELPFVLQVNPKTPIMSVADLTNFLKAKKGDATYAAPNAMALIASELYMSIAQAGAIKVPYKSIQTAQTDLMAGEIDFVFIASTLAMEPGRSGKLRSLAVTSAHRSSIMPELPTMAEAGVPNYELSTWSAIFAPRGTPPEVIRKLAGWINDIAKSEETRRFLSATLVADPFSGTPESLAAQLQQQYVRWGELVKIAKIEPQ